MLNKFLPAIKTTIFDHRVFFFLMAFYAFLSTFMLEKYPRVWVDEPWESITASTLAHEGKMYNLVLENYTGFDKVLLQPRLFLSMAVAPAFALFGVGPVQGRLVSAACGALLMIAVYLFTSKFFSKRAALFAVWFVMIETMMFISYRTIRPEIYLVTLESYSMLFLFQGIRANSKAYFFWSGLFAGVALWTHPNAVLHVGAVAVLLLLTYKSGAFTSRYSWSFAAALLIALLPYLIYVIANDARNSFSTFYLQLDNRTSSLAQQNWLATSLRGEWNRIVEYAQFPYRAPIVLVFASVWVRSLVSKKIETRNVAIVVGMYILLSILVISNKTVLYTTSVLPMLCILAAVNTDELLGAPHAFGERIRRIFHSGYFRESLGIGLFVLLSLNQLAGDARLLWHNRNCSYTETIKQLQTVIPPDARVWGSITFWFGFQHQPLRTQYTHLREVDTFKPEYMITGDTEIWGKDFWKSVRDDADAVIKERGTLVAEFPENCYGTLRVYHLRW